MPLQGLLYLLDSLPKRIFGGINHLDHKAQIFKRGAFFPWTAAAHKGAPIAFPNLLLQFGCFRIQSGLSGHPPGAGSYQKHQIDVRNCRVTPEILFLPGKRLYEACGTILQVPLKARSGRWIGEDERRRPIGERIGAVGVFVTPSRNMRPLRNASA